MTWKTLLLAGAAALLPVPPAQAQDEAPAAEAVDYVDAATPEVDAAARQKREMDALMAMMGGMFDTSGLPPVDPARLELSTITAAKLVPQGAYAKMMDEVFGKMMGSMFSGDAGFNDIGIAMKTGVDYETIGALDKDKKAAVMQLLDPHAKERSDAMMGLFRPMMAEVMTELEPPLREGLARAYARKFSAAELTAMNAWFATPTGARFASESFALFADPEVMQASFKVLPIVLEKMTGSEADVKAKMDALPKERQLSDLSDAELEQLAGLLGLSVDKLKEHRDLYAMTDDMAATDAAMAAGEAADAAMAEGDYGPWYERENWSPADLAKVEKIEAESNAIFTKSMEAQEAAIANARKRLEKDGAAPASE